MTDLDNRIFIHVPKCGGMSIWLNHSPLHYTAFGFQDQHVRVKDYLDKFPKEVLTNWRAYGIIRNPYDRLVSWFTFHKQKGFNTYKPYETFSQWVKDNVRHHWTNYSERIGFYPYQQASWLTDNGLSTGNIMVEVYKLEELQINGKSNSSTRKPYQEYYTDQETIDIVTELTQNDLNRFGYSYE